MENSVNTNTFELGEIESPDPKFGDKINDIPFAYHLLPQEGLARAAMVMRKGERNGREPNGWRGVTVEEHINHAISHLVSFLSDSGGLRDDHLAHAVCRTLMACSMVPRQPPEESEERKEPYP